MSTKLNVSTLYGYVKDYLRITFKGISMKKMIAILVAATFAMGTAFAQSADPVTSTAPVAAQADHGKVAKKHKKHAKKKHHKKAHAKKVAAQ